MSTDQEINYEELLMKPEINNVIEALIKDQAFSVAFLASCIMHYYCKELKLNPKTKGGE